MRNPSRGAPVFPKRAACSKTRKKTLSPNVPCTLLGDDARWSVLFILSAQYRERGGQKILISSQRGFEAAEETQNVDLMRSVDSSDIGNIPKQEKDATLRQKQNSLSGTTYRTKELSELLRDLLYKHSNEQGCRAGKVAVERKR